MLLPSINLGWDEYLYWITECGPLLSFHIATSLGPQRLHLVCCQGKSLPGFVLGVRLSRGRNNREGTSKLLFLLLLGLFLLSFHRLQRSIPIPIRRILRKVDLALGEEESKFSMRKKDGSGSVGLLSIGPQKAVKSNLVHFLCHFPREDRKVSWKILIFATL